MPPKISEKIQKRIFLFFFRWSTGLLVLIAAVIIILLTAPKVRHGTYLFSLEVPGFVINFFLKQYVPIRRFDKALPWLDRELKLVNWFAPPRNRLLPGLIDNTRYAIERARFPEEFALFLPFLNRLVDSHPDLYPARLWLARALADTEPQAIFEHLEVAAKLSSADDRPYRIAIALALKKNMPKKLKEWCDRYRKSQFGGLNSMDYDSLFHGIGLREMALEVIDVSGKRQLVGNMGLQLGETRTYEFPLQEGVSIGELHLHLAVVPGIAVTVENLRLYKGGQQTANYEGDFMLTSWSGFHLEDGRVLTISKDGERITIHPPAGGFGEADLIEAKLHFERLGLASPTPCGKGKI